MNTIQQTGDSTAQIIELHKRIIGNARTSLALAKETGRLLVMQKARLQHGEWLPWVTNSLPFGCRTAARYISIYEAREALQLDNVSNLRQAYRLLAEPRSLNRSDATAAATEIREALEAAAAFVIPAVMKLRRIRDLQLFTNEHTTFVAFLESRGLTLEWFDYQEKVYAAFVEWADDGSTVNLFETLQAYSGDQLSKGEDEGKEDAFLEVTQLQ